MKHTIGLIAFCCLLSVAQAQQPSSDTPPEAEAESSDEDQGELEAESSDSGAGRQLERQEAEVPLEGPEVATARRHYQQGVVFFRSDRHEEAKCASSGKRRQLSSSGSVESPLTLGGSASGSLLPREQ